MNLHELPRYHLKVVRLPIPPPGRGWGIIEAVSGQYNAGMSGAFCVILALVVLSMGQVMRAERGDLRVMSFNIRLDTPKDGDNAWPARKELWFDAVQAFDPDLLGLQEVLPKQGQAIAERFGKTHTFVGVPREDGKSRGEMSAVLFRTERFEKVREGTFWLSQTPDEPGSKGWDADIPRVATWVELRDRANDGRTIYFFNTHFDHRGKTARLESARLLRARIAEIAKDNPVIVTGDFNASEGSPPYQQLTGEGTPALVDTFKERFGSATTQRSSFHGFSGKSTGDQRIDWILRSGSFRTVEADIDRFHSGQRYPSDHFAVTAVLRWLP